MSSICYMDLKSYIFIQAGLTLRSLPWENKEIDADDVIEKFYSEGREDELVEASHFQGLFLLMGILISVGLGKSS